MKKVFAAAIACMFTMLRVAGDHPRDGRLRISNNSRQHISIMIDGRLIRDYNGLFMVGLSPGNHEIRVYRHGNRHNRKKGKLVYRNTVHVHPMEEVRMIIRRDGKVWVEDHDRRRDRNDYRNRHPRRYDRHYH